MSKTQHLTAREAADLLGISLPTLYAYVSRGQLRSIEGDTRRRTKRYAWDDVERLRQRQTLKRAPQGAVEGALSWGLPLVPSSISLISDGRLFYRGEDAVELSRTRTFEEVTHLLWTGEIRSGLFESGRETPPRVRRLVASLGPVHPVTAIALSLPLIGEDDPAAYDTRPAATPKMGATLIRALFETAGGGPTVEHLARAWGVPQAIAALEAVLVLCADHELNASSFTARCVASTGAGLPACLSGGLAALTGPKHGRSAESAAAMLREVPSAHEATDAIARRLRRGDGVPGFGHPLYPGGDPRGRRMMEIVRELTPTSERLAIVLAVEAAAHQVLDEAPTIDFGLASLGFLLGLPEHVPLTLFALGRSAGWIAHAMEEYERGVLIRPRARYAGKVPTP